MKYWFLDLPAPQKQHVENRAVFFIGGFDPKSADAFFKRTDRENRRFEEVWGATVRPVKTKDLFKDITRAQYEACGIDHGESWTTKTDYHFLTLDDMIQTEFQKPFLVRLWRYLVTFFDYLLSGTAFRFIKYAWRFSLYFFYPAFMIAIAFVLGFLVARQIGSSGLPVAWLIGPLAFVITFYTCILFGGKRYHVAHLMDLWSFSRDFIRQEQKTIRHKLDKFSDCILAADASNKYDEILLVGHSTGGALILDAAGRAAEKSLEFGTRGSIVAVLTVGSTALKIGLHPSAGWFRKRVKNLFEQHPVAWVEYQCLNDVINFHKTNPAKLMGFADQMQRQMKTGRIKIKYMLVPTKYKQIRRNFFRVHYQFIYGNNFKYYYDFPAICFGPALIDSRASSPYAYQNSLTGNVSQPGEAA